MPRKRAAPAELTRARTERANPKNFHFVGYLFDGETYYGVGEVDGETDPYILTSLDGVTWTRRPDG